MLPRVVGGSVGGEDNHIIHVGMLFLGGRYCCAVSAGVLRLHAEDVRLLRISGCIHSDLGVCALVQEELLRLASHSVISRAAVVDALLVVAALLVVRSHEHVVVGIGLRLLIHVLMFRGCHPDVLQATGLAEAVEGSQALRALVGGAREILRGIDTLHEALGRSHRAVHWLELADWAWSGKRALQAHITTEFLRAERAIVPIRTLPRMPSSRLRPDELLVISKIARSLIGARPRRR